ncbi:hypothetical protein B296_00023139 [Ensete ventricosum]|uniref:Retrotransposon Copia-like N-terminal domain-containing protein n=1 Tax=Ensete ventricosum TaxID=4639 RepID=A0A426YLL3_ENSVE|nr:hypothetical protein B296_00023139 [Ensete ventricosum]
MHALCRFQLAFSSDISRSPHCPATTRRTQRPLPCRTNTLPPLPLLQPYCYCLFPLEPIADTPAAPLLAALAVALVLAAAIAAPLRRSPLSHLLLSSASPSSSIDAGPLPVNYQQQHHYRVAPHSLGAPHDVAISYPHCQRPPHFLSSTAAVLLPQPPLPITPTQSSGHLFCLSFDSTSPMPSSSTSTSPTLFPVENASTSSHEGLISINAASLIPFKLSKSVNYTSWRAQFYNLLFGYGLLGYVDGSFSCPPAMIHIPSDPSPV